MLFREFLDQRQTDSAAFESSSVCILHTIETFEKMRQIFSGNSGTRILYREFDGTINFPQRNLDPALKSKFKSIGEQIEDNLLP